MRRSHRILTWTCVVLVAVAVPAAGHAAPALQSAKFHTIYEYRGNQIILDGDVPSGLEGATKIIAAYQTADGLPRTTLAVDDKKGRYTVVIDATDLADHTAIHLTFWNQVREPQAWIDAWRIGGQTYCMVEDISTNETIDRCICGDCGQRSSATRYDTSREPRASGVQIYDGVVTTALPIVGFLSRLLGFEFTIFHQTLKVCDGELGQSASSTLNATIKLTSPTSGFFRTPGLEVFPISAVGFPSNDGRWENWKVSESFFSHLRMDLNQRRWVLTHNDGGELEFVVGAEGQPGPLIGIREPNGNFTRVNRDPSGFVSSVVTDLGQEVLFNYADDGHLASITDHLGRSWSFSYDMLGNLTAITGPPTEFADIAAGEEITDAIFGSASGPIPRSNGLVVRGRRTTMSYDDPRFPHHITRITDERDAVPIEYAYVQEGPDAGRVATKRINGEDVTFLYNPPSTAVPAPLALLEPGNSVTRVIDREGNVTDYEMHGPTGGPLANPKDPLVGLGRFGLRRKVMWTARGKGEESLRDGEPLAWERRWLQDCDCLAPRKVSQPFRYEGSGALLDDDGYSISFDAYGMPKSFPTEVFEYNDRRQVTAYKYTRFHGLNEGGETENEGALCEGAEILNDTICWTKTFSSFEELSRQLTYTEPRAFDGNALYDGLNFTHNYEYDAAGNRVRHDAPVVTRGVEGQQIISETSTFNEFGQMNSHTDANGNITTYDYFDGPSTGGDINTKGEFGGYLASVTRGAEGSADPVTELTARYKVNALGMTTEHTDPKGFVYDYEYNDLGEKVRDLDAEVTLRNDQLVRYESRYVYDGAGNRVISRRSNVHLDGTVPENDFIDHSQSFDDVNNLLSARVEVDGEDANDLVTRYAYDKNDQLSVVQQPEGNRSFHVYDERRLRFKTFYGIAPSGDPEDPAESYPEYKRAETLDGPSFVSFTTTAYDARRNVVRTRDGRGNFVDHFYDFFNRSVATSDQNGNGMVYEYDDASNQLTHEGGAVSKDSGDITEILERSYYRYDEIGRRFQSVLDIDLASNEGGTVDPDDGASSSFLTTFDPGSRVVTRFDANGNPTTNTYDAADRTLSVTDALGNVRSFELDKNSNVVQVSELERPGPGAEGDDEIYITTNEFDELNRRTETHIRGLISDPIDHETFYAYDSRNNTRLVKDAEDNFTRSTFDDLDRVVMTQRFNGDPGAGEIPAGVTELIHYEYRYDDNSRKTHDIAFSDVTDPSTEQVTGYAYDDLDRLARTVYPDADDPVDGLGDGPDGVYDRVELGYDANSNMTMTREQRNVVFDNMFDPGNRLVEQDIDLSESMANPERPEERVPGTDRQKFEYDALNRLTAARNNYSQVGRDFDPLSRLVLERQEIRLDGSGFGNGYERPIELHFEHDRQSNCTLVRVMDETGQEPVLDLETRHTFDALNRMDGIDADYFDQPLHDIVDYTFLGPWRVHQKRLGNGAALNVGYDAKRRIDEYVWRDATSEPDQNVLVGFEYDYDDVDNPLYERFLHDQDLYDNFSYNDRYELTGVNYRSPQPTDYRVDPADYSTTFDYDDNFNRHTASFGDPFGNLPNTEDVYAINKANEYNVIDRQGGVPPGPPPSLLEPPVHDAAGNMTRFPVRPSAGGAAGQNVNLNATWDASSLLFTATVPDPDLSGGQFLEDYRYDPFRRRIAKFDMSDDECVDCPQPSGRRYIYDGWSVVEERVFEVPLAVAIPHNLDDRLERIYVSGRTIDEPTLAAVDGDDKGDRRDGGLPRNSLPGGEFEYYYLCNRMGSTMGLVDSQRHDRILEYYRYTLYGQTTVISLRDGSGGGTAEDEFEDTPDDLGDNPAQLFSDFGNLYTFTARRVDPGTGLYYFRNRYYEPVNGRFVGRDPYANGLNLYASFDNLPTALLDPFGTQSEPKQPSEWTIKELGHKQGNSENFLLPSGRGYFITIPYQLSPNAIAESYFLNQEVRVTRRIVCCNGKTITAHAHYFESFNGVKGTDVQASSVAGAEQACQKEFGCSVAAVSESRQNLMYLGKLNALGHSLRRVYPGGTIFIDYLLFHKREARDTAGNIRQAIMTDIGDNDVRLPPGYVTMPTVEWRERLSQGFPSGPLVRSEVIKSVLGGSRVHYSIYFDARWNCSTNPSTFRDSFLLMRSSWQRLNIFLDYRND